MADALVADTDVIVGRPIAFDGAWGSALTAFISRLTPEFVVAAPAQVHGRRMPTPWGGMGHQGDRFFGDPACGTRQANARSDANAPPCQNAPRVRVKRKPRMHPVRRSMLILIALTITSPALFAAYGDQPPAHLAEPPPRLHTTSSGDQGLARREVPLWPEDSGVLQAGIRALAGKENAVTRPSLLLYRPRVRSRRAAILVFPGGGFKALAIGEHSTIGLEGADVCSWLTDAGVVCVLVKYRVPDTACNWNPVTRKHEAPAIPMALQDAQRAISIVRHRASAYGIDPDRIGVMGFSAGGNLAVLSSTAFNARSYAPVDENDQASSRPDFAIPVYPGHLTMEHKNKTPREVAARELNTDIVISSRIPPTLLIHAKDDAVDPVHYSEVYARELRKAGLDVTLNLYETGGHAFGVRKQGTDTDRWMDDAVEWLKGKGIL